MALDGLIRSLHSRGVDRESGVADAELLARYAEGKDDAAFELLIRRHAEMVWRVCRAVTRDHHTAEDAFQAVFLALSRSASNGVRESVAGWLYRAAYHAALKAKSARRYEPITEPAERGFSDPPAAERAELASVLHEELNGLAERYRLPLVLCELEGYTQAEAARSLGWPLGTVATRVNRGRNLLRRRLTARGIGLSVAGVVAALVAAPASARSPLLAADACQAVCTGSATLPIRHLADAVLTALTRSKKGLVLAGTALTLLLGVAVAVAAWPAAEARLDAPAPPVVREGQRPLSAVIVVYDRDLVTRTVAIRDVADLAALEACFPDYRKRPAEGAAVPWQPGFEVYFNFPDGNTVRVTISPQDVRPPVWSVGRGQFPLTGSFTRFLSTPAAPAPGETPGAWSQPVNGLKARLIVAKGPPVNGTPLVTTRVEVQLNQTPPAPVTVPWSKNTIHWTVRDAGGKQIHRGSAAGNWPAEAPTDLVLPDTQPRRVLVSGSGTALAANKRFGLDLTRTGTWSFETRDTTDYSLSARLVIEPSPRNWSGQIEIPSVRIPGSGK